MGFSGSFLLCRTDDPFDEIDVINDRDEGLEWSQRLNNGWQVGQYLGTYIVNDASALLRDLVGATDAPALTGFVLDSDCVDVEAYGRVCGSWRACLNRPAMAAYLNDQGVNLDDRFLSPEDALARAMQWATEARLPATPEALRALLVRTQSELLAENTFFALLRGLGLHAINPS